MARSADGPTVASEVNVAAPPDRVWMLVGDITTPARFGGELYEAEWLDGAPERPRDSASVTRLAENIVTAGLAFAESEFGTLTNDSKGIS